MTFPDNLFYSKTHEWVFLANGKARVGLTDFAQDALGDVVFISLPHAGDAISAGEAVGEVESVKAVSEIFAPVGGVITAVNDELADAPEKVNAAPYDAWLFELETASDAESLLTAEQYKLLCDAEAGA